MFPGIFKAIALAGTTLVVGLLTSCQQETGYSNLAILDWNGYQDHEYFPEYLDKYGREPAYTYFAETEDAMQRLRTGYKVDLAHLCPGQMDEARASGLIKPLDINRIPRWGDISPELLAMKGMQAGGEYWMVPWEWGYSVVAYNPELIDIDPDEATFDLFIDPRFKGLTALNSQVGVSLFIAGIIGGWADPWDPTEKEMEAAPGIFTKMLENARFFWSDSTQFEQAWAAGDVGISYVFGSGSRRMKREGLPIELVEPYLTWFCGYQLSATGTGSEDQAYDYIDAMLDPRGGLHLFNKYGYGHGNSRSVDLIDPARVVGTGVDDPAGTFARGVFSFTHPPAKRARLFQLWFEARAALD
jgi:spermidine/putrescine-binding protein